MMLKDITLDPQKVNAISSIPPPINMTKPHEFLGLVTFLAPFIPSLSTKTAPV